MLSYFLINAIVYTMSQPISAQPRKKLAKSALTPSSTRNNNHKLKRISSTSTYIVDDGDGLDRGKPVTIDNSAVGTDPKKDPNYVDKRIDQTTSCTMFTGGRKFWNQCNSKPSNIYVPDNSVIEEESEVISALTKQLYMVESQMQKIQTDLKRNEDLLKLKDQEIGRLKRKVKDWEVKSKNQESQYRKEQQQRRIQTDHSEYLYRRCLMLEQRIYEMEKFLGDYGLMWVGDTNNPKCTDTALNNYIETCYEQIIANIDQLNLAAGKGEVHVQHNEKGHGATFKTPSCMSLKFYKNGMIVQDGPLRPYDDPTTMSFLRDILDGYFPSELQQAYPNGVPFKVKDHRTQTYLSSSVDFPGHGYRLGKHPPPDNAPLPSATRTRRPSTTSQKSRNSSISKDSFHANDLSSSIMPMTARSLKSRSTVEAVPSEMYVLRSQILASHNNICSDTHLQSHINAELGLSTRKEKRDSPEKTSEYCAMRDVPLKSKISRVPSSSRCYHSSTDRSFKQSPRRLDVEDRIRQRSRSASLPNSRMTMAPKPITKAKPNTDFGNVDHSQFSSPQMPFGARKKNARPGKSAATARKSAHPVLHQINEPSGKPGELRLKVRSLNGGTIYLAHVSTDEPLARLYQLLDRAMVKPISKGYKVVLSGYSPRRLEQLGSTLREIGITRDSVLHLVND